MCGLRRQNDLANPRANQFAIFPVCFQSVRHPKLHPFVDALAPETLANAA